MEEYQTTDYLTKFEFARVLGMRVLQLNQSNATREDPYAIAKREIQEGSNPAVIRRRLPNNTFEDRAVKDLKLSADVQKMMV